MSGDPRPVGEDDLHALVDGRLEPERAAAVEAWLADHPEAAARVAADRAVRRSLRARLAPVHDEPIPARLRVAEIAAQRGVRRTAIAGRWLPFAAALCLALGTAGGWLGRGALAPPTPSASALPAPAPSISSAEAAAAPPESATRAAVSAFRTFVVEAAHPVEVRAEEKPHLVAWLSNRLGRPVAAPDLRAQGFRLMGGRLLPAGNEPAAMLMYDDDRGTRLTLYSRAVGTDADGRSPFRYAREGDVAAFSWIDGGMAYVVAARTDEARLLRAAEAVGTQVRGR